MNTLNIYLSTCPKITSDTSFPLTLALFNTSFMTVQPNWWAFKDDSDPLNEPVIIIFLVIKI